MKTNIKGILAGSLVFGTLALGGFLAVPTEARPHLSDNTHSSERVESVRRELGTFAKLTQELNPTVVSISVVGTSRLRSNLPEEFRRLIPRELLPKIQGREQQVSGQGSGVIIGHDGQVLTNNHVVEGAREIRVSLSDGREFEAEIVGTDPNTDLALLHLKKAQDLPAAKLGDSDSLAVGDWVMAIGNPFGLEATVTVGVLSGKGRVIGAGPYDDFLQTDASINPGNSGGPLFNISGEVVGINTAMVKGGQGIGFAIPINLAKEISRQLAQGGKVERGFLGVGAQTLTPALRRALSLPDEVKGALVASIIPDSAAAKAGIAPADLIVSIGGNKVENHRELLKEVAKISPGSRTDIKVLRDGKEKTIKLTLDSRPVETAARSEKPTAQPGERQYRLGLGVLDQGTAEETRVVVAEVLPNSPAARAGLHRGDRIHAVGRKAIRNAAEFHQLVEQTPKGALALLVEQEGRSTYLTIEE